MSTPNKTVTTTYSSERGPCGDFTFLKSNLAPLPSQDGSGASAVQGRKVVSARTTTTTTDTTHNEPTEDTQQRQGPNNGPLPLDTATTGRRRRRYKTTITRPMRSEIEIDVRLGYTTEEVKEATDDVAAQYPFCLHQQDYCWCI